METKKERFKRLAAHRTNEVIYRLKVLSNCSNRQLYEYDEKDVNKIFSEIDKKINFSHKYFNICFALKILNNLLSSIYLQRDLKDGLNRFNLKLPAKDGYNLNIRFL